MAAKTAREEGRKERQGTVEEKVAGGNDAAENCRANI